MNIQISSFQNNHVLHMIITLLRDVRPVPAFPLLRRECKINSVNTLNIPTLLIDPNLYYSYPGCRLLQWQEQYEHNTCNSPFADFENNHCYKNAIERPFGGNGCLIESKILC